MPFLWNSKTTNPVSASTHTAQRSDVPFAAGWQMHFSAHSGLLHSFTSWDGGGDFSRWDEESGPRDRELPDFSRLSQMQPKRQYSLSQTRPVGVDAAATSISSLSVVGRHRWQIHPYRQPAGGVQRKLRPINYKCNSPLYQQPAGVGKEIYRSSEQSMIYTMNSPLSLMLQSFICPNLLNNGSQFIIKFVFYIQAFYYF